MAIRITRGKVSDKAWGDVDKSAIWQRLKQALQNGEAGAAEAVREIYAVVKAEINADLTQADCWGPHHEIDGDAIVLNRNGLIAAAQALAGARAEPNLTPEQRRTAARHLLRHYREIKLEPPASLLEAAGQSPGGEMIRLAAAVTGEIRVEDVPVAPWADLSALKAGDDDPLEVVVEVPAGKSKRGWNYRPEALQKIVGEVMRSGLPGFLGHQKPEDVDHQFPQPVTHWIGAKWENGKAYFRGLVDAAAKDLKRWIRSKVVRQVSIYGIPTLQQTAGETQVTDYQPLSIDWTPLNRAGMPTRIVAVGEMDTTFVNNGQQPKKDDPNGGDSTVTLQEALAVVREHLQKKNATVAGICGEMGWDFNALANELGGEEYRTLQERAEAVGEMAELFGLPKDAQTKDVIEAAKEARKEQQEAAKAKREQLIDKVVGEMVTAEAARPLVKRMLQVPEDADEAKIRQAVGEMLQQEDVKQALADLFKDHVFRPQADNKSNTNTTTGLVVRRVRI